MTHNQVEPNFKKGLCMFEAIKHHQKACECCSEGGKSDCSTNLEMCDMTLNVMSKLLKKIPLNQIGRYSTVMHFLSHIYALKGDYYQCSVLLDSLVGFMGKNTNFLVSQLKKERNRE